MVLSKLSAKCQACPFVDTCDHKEMEALGYLPLPEPAAQPTETGYRNVENLFGSNPASGGLVRTGGEINIDMEGLVRKIAGVVQLPEQVLGRALTSVTSEKLWQKFLEVNGFL